MGRFIRLISLLALVPLAACDAADGEQGEDRVVEPFSDGKGDALLACHPALESALEDCMHSETLAEAYQLSMDALVDQCRPETSEEAERLCSDSVEDGCEDPVALHDSCTETWRHRYPSAPDGFIEDELDSLQSLRTAIDLSPSCRAAPGFLCRFSGRLFTREDARWVPDELVALARSTSLVGPGLYVVRDGGEPDSFEQLLESFYDAQVVSEYQSVLAEAGVSADDAKVDVLYPAERFRSEGKECSGRMFVMSFESTEQLLVLEHMICNE